MERNIKLLIAYDGTDFHGWQFQPGMRTVQGVLEESARHVLRHPLSLRGSGRTDSGVHAAGQVANVRTTSTMAPEKIARALASRLPHDLHIRDARQVHDDFDAVRSSVAKLYRYRVYCRQSRPVEQFAQRYCYHFFQELDVDRMQQAAQLFVGTMDFSSMAAAGCMRATMVRTVVYVNVYQHLHEFRFDVCGRGFLYRQVRNMVGTLLEVGTGRWPVERVAEILASQDRSQAGATAPAHGLSLQWVQYVPEMLRPADSESLSEAAEPAS